MKLDELKQDLHYFCYDLAHNEERERAFVSKVEEFEESGMTFDEALKAAQRESPGLAREPRLYTDFEQFLDETAEAMLQGDTEDEYVEALEAARELYPGIAALSDLHRDNPELFREACYRVGKLIGGPRFEEDRVIDLVLEESKEVSKQTLEVHT